MIKSGYLNASDSNTKISYAFYNQKANKALLFTPPGLTGTSLLVVTNCSFEKGEAERS